MIATLKGIVSEKHLDTLILDVGGVGYGILVPLATSAQLILNETVKLHIYEQLREDTFDLYGFVDVETKRLFEQLVNVNGVGPKMALNILSIGSDSEVRSAIASGNTRLIQTAHGVGKRVAERVIVELKDKVGLVDSVDEEALFTSSKLVNEEEAVQALVALGYSVGEAMTALKNVGKDLPTEERVKLALKAK